MDVLPLIAGTVLKGHAVLNGIYAIGYHKTHSNCISVHYLSITASSCVLYEENEHLCSAYIGNVRAYVRGATALHKGLLAIAVSTRMFIASCTDRESAFIDWIVAIRTGSIHTFIYERDVHEHKNVINFA